MAYSQAASEHRVRRVLKSADGKRELYCLLTLVALCAVLGLDLLATKGSLQSVFAPGIFAGVAVLAGLGSVAQLFRAGPRPSSDTTNLGWRRLSGVVLLPVVFVVLWPVLGLRFYLAAPIVVALGAWIIRSIRPLWKLALLLIAIDVAVWLVFANFLKVPL